MVVEEKDSGLYDCPYKMSADTIYKGCVGKRCMAWEWSKIENPDFDSDLLWEDSEYSVMPFIVSKDKGFCGIIKQS